MKCDAKRLKYNRIITVCLCLVFFLNGCGSTGADYALGTGEYGFVLPEGEIDTSYEVPEVGPNVYVDCFGYEPDSEKVVVFRGEDMPDTFAVRDAESRETVYSGQVKKRGTAEEGDEYNSYGDFSEFQKPGNYYIQIDTYGESYSFMIHDNLYYSLFKRSCEKLYAMRSASGEGTGWNMKGTGEKKEIDVCLCIYKLLFSYELFPEVYTDDMGIAESGNGIPDILDECRYEMEWLLRRSEAETDTGGTACCYRAAVFSKYAYLTKNTDVSFAGECLKAAEAAWKEGSQDLSVPDELVALAASELYRVTGSRNYLGLAEEYLGNSVEKTERLSEAEFYGAVTYMNTKNEVDVELCDAMIKKMMEEAEEIAEKSKEDPFLVYSRDGRSDQKTILEEMLRICVVNHVITNHEYNRVIENHFHYLMGRNPSGVCHVSYWEGQEMETEDLLEDPVQNAAFIFMLSELLSNQS